MVVLWILAGLMSALAALMVLTAARRGANAARLEQPDLASRELDELDRMRARGLLSDDAWTAARAETGRRVLATPVIETVEVAGRNDGRWVLGSIAATGAVALGIYAVFGAPGLPDQAYERRVDAWSNSLETLEPAQIAAVIARVVKEQPDDHQALTMLGAARFEAGDPLGAASAFRRALVLQPGDAQSWARLGEALVRSQQGVVGGDAEAAFRRAIRINPGQLGARFFLGEAALARNDLAEARTMWEPLIAALDPADPRRDALQQQLAAAAVAP